MVGERGGVSGLPGGEEQFLLGPFFHTEERGQPPEFYPNEEIKYLKKKEKRTTTKWELKQHGIITTIDRLAS